MHFNNQLILSSIFTLNFFYLEIATKISDKLGMLLNERATSEWPKKKSKKERCLGFWRM